MLFLLPVVLFIHVDCFTVSNQVLEISAIDMSVFVSNIMELATC